MGYHLLCEDSEGTSAARPLFAEREQDRTRQLCGEATRDGEHVEIRSGEPMPARLVTGERPLPQPTRDNAPFYAAAVNGELRFQRCTTCGTFRHYPRPSCPKCLSREYTWERSSGHGRVFTWTIVRGPTLPAFEHKLPYNVVDVLMDEGVHFISEVLDCRPEDIREGMPVETVLVPVSDEITLVKFRMTHR
jgi:uncharacterized OB-fold protein